MSSSRNIQQIEADLKAIKDANPDWASNPVDMALITALIVEKNRISASSAPAGKFIIKTHSILLNKILIQIINLI